jgi:hypothetical protein
VEARNNALFNRNNPFLRQRNETVEGWVSLSGGMLGRFNTRENLAAGRAAAITVAYLASCFFNKRTPLLLRWYH